MESHLIKAYSEIVEHCMKEKARLEMEIENLIVENAHLKEKLRLQDKCQNSIPLPRMVYIHDMHGTIDGNATINN